MKTAKKVIGVLLLSALLGACDVDSVSTEMDESNLLVELEESNPIRTSSDRKEGVLGVDLGTPSPQYTDDEEDFPPPPDNN